MCTSITYSASDGSYFLSRTMDFSFDLGARPVALPRHYRWKGTHSADYFENKFGIIGSGKLLGDTYFFADAVNEAGLCGACLYFPEYANYETNSDATVNLAPHELVAYIIGRCASLSEVVDMVGDINISNTEIPLIGILPPLHWIFTDSSSRTIVLESDSGSLVCKDNPVGVLTNSPNLEWHITNLSNYLGLTTAQLPPVNFSDSYTARAFGQGSGSLSLPGGYTPPQRFVRSAFLRSSLPKIESSEEAIVSLLHLLHSFDIPRGANVKVDGSDDYTQYTAVLCGATSSMIFVGHSSLIPFEARVDDFSELNAPVEFTVQNIKLA